jgi:hypothetical protein
VKRVKSVGVRVALRVAGPEAAGTQEHLAMKGATVVVATVWQPTIGALPTAKATFPGAPAVATMMAGSRPNTVLPPERTRVGAVAAASAVDTPTIEVADMASATINAFLFLLFIALLLLVVN